MPNTMPKILSLALALSILLLAGCGDDEKVKPMRFYVEMAASGHAGEMGKTLELPISHLTYNVRSDPLFTEVDITNVQMVQVASGEYALLFHLNEVGSRKLYRQSVTNNGRVVIFEYGGKPLGARQLDGAISDGRFFTFVELPEPKRENLEKLVLEMQGDTKTMNENLREARF